MHIKHNGKDIFHVSPPVNQSEQAIEPIKKIDILLKNLFDLLIILFVLVSCYFSIAACIKAARQNPNAKHENIELL
jgi:hypothetical protein